MIAGLSLDLRSGGLAFLSGTLALAALVAVAGALAVGGGRLIGGALGLLGFAYFVHVLLVGESSTWLLAVVSVGLLLVGELVQWSVDSRLRGRHEVRMHLGRMVGLGWLAALGTGVVVLGLVAAALPVGDGILPVVLATVGSVALLGLISTVGRPAAG